MRRPETSYVAVGGARVAYKVLGEGSPDVIYCYGLGSGHVDLVWDVPGTVEFWERAASFCRPIIFDRRGTGASEPVPGVAMPTWEDWAEDLGAVLDAVASTEAVLVAELDAGPTAILFAALHPERVKALVLINTAARYLRAKDYEIGVAPDSVDALVEVVSRFWGTPQVAALANPGLLGNDEGARLIARMARASATPHAAAAQFDYILRNMDVRRELPLIHVPTLVLHRRDNSLVPVELGRYLADQIPEARFVELPGGDVGLPSTDILEELAEFLTGQPRAVEPDTILTTLLFTDIVGSTVQAASVGDQRWRALLDSHDGLVRSQLRRYRGREINTTGDGFLAIFDGPARALRCAAAIIDATQHIGVEIRAGVHTGECQVRGGDVAGMAVHIAARIGATARRGEILVSQTVKDLVVGSDIAFDERGEHELKGVPGSWKLFAVANDTIR